MPHFWKEEKLSRSSTEGGAQTSRATVINNSVNIAFKHISRVVKYWALPRTVPPISSICRLGRWQNDVTVARGGAGCSCFGFSLRNRQSCSAQRDTRRRNYHRCDSFAVPALLTSFQTCLSAADLPVCLLRWSPYLCSSSPSLLRTPSARSARTPSRSRTPKTKHSCCRSRVRCR